MTSSDEAARLEEKVRDLEHLLDVQQRVALEHAERRERAHDRLIQSEANFKALVAQLPDAVFVEQDGGIRYVNASMVRMLGYPANEIIGSENRLFLHPDDRAEVALYDQRIDRCERPDPLQVRWLRKDKSAVVVERTRSWLAYDGKPAALVFARDVTEKRHLEEQLRHSQKMDAVGQLAGGIAHDFNNLLSVILSYATLLLQDLEPDSPMHVDLTEVRLAGERAASLTKQLLAFSRKQILEPKNADLNELLGGMETMLRRLLGEAVTLLFSPAVGLGEVFVDRGQIEQVVMNLVVNARDASCAGSTGRVSIETQNVTLDDAYAAANLGVNPGRFVRIQVADDGRGMDESTLARIFEPFFTTKPKDKGTGLGLSTVFGIVEQSGGHIRVHSEVGKGSTFQVYFPRVDAAVRTTSAPTMALSPRRGAAETILLVEDEEQVRRTVCAILWRQGYTVLEAQNGGEAFMICERHDGPIHLLVTDVVMPVMNGREVAARLAPMRPEMRVLYMSGYTEHAIVRDGALENGLAFLQKPVTPEALVRKVREVLTSSTLPAELTC